MPPSITPLRVAVAAAPPLLADTLRALLVDGHTDVTLLTDDTSERFDVIIATEGSTNAAPASVRIVLDESATSSGGGTARLPGDVDLPLDDLTALLGFVRGLATGSPDVVARAEG